MGICHGDGFKFDACVFHRLADDHVIGHRFDSRARFGNDDAHDGIPGLRSAVRLEEFDEAADFMGIDVVAGKEGLRIAFAGFRALEVPKFAALHVEEDLAA